MTTAYDISYFLRWYVTLHVNSLNLIAQTLIDFQHQKLQHVYLHDSFGDLHSKRKEDKDMNFFVDKTEVLEC